MLKLAEISVLLIFQSFLKGRVETSTRVFFDMLLPSFLNSMPPAPSCLRAFGPYIPHALLCLFALHVFELNVPYALCALLTHLARFCVFSSLRALYTLFVHFNIALGWIFIPAKTYYFPRTVKGTTNCAAFKWVKKQPLKFLSGENFMLLCRLLI